MVSCRLTRVRYQEEAPPVELKDDDDESAPTGRPAGFSTGLDAFARGVLEENERLENDIADLNAEHAKCATIIFELTRKRDAAVQQVSRRAGLESAGCSMWHVAWWSVREGWPELCLLRP